MKIFLVFFVVFIVSCNMPPRIFECDEKYRDAMVKKRLECIKNNNHTVSYCLHSTKAIYCKEVTTTYRE